MNNLEQYFMLDRAVTFLNHGSFGATPIPVLKACQQWQTEMEKQPVEFLGRKADEMLYESRAALGNFLGTRPENLVFVTNATYGMNVAATSLQLGPGDVVLSTNHEYGAVDRAWKFAALRQGFEFRAAKLETTGKSHAELIEDFWSQVTNDVKVISISHITSPTALIFPVQEIVRRARNQGIIIVIDGAHAPGQIALNLDELDADIYTGNLHKWLCAPKGSGFLYVNPRVQQIIQPLVVSWGWESISPSAYPWIDYHQWIGTRDLSAFLSVPEAIRFHQTEIAPRIPACHALAKSTGLAIQELTGIPLLHNHEDVWFEQMAAAPLPPTLNAARLKEDLYNRYRIEIPVIEWNGMILIRYSYQIYNSATDQEHLLAALKELATP